MKRASQRETIRHDRSSDILDITVPVGARLPVDLESRFCFKPRGGCIDRCRPGLPAAY
jgi:hypothetical protein